MSDVHDEMKQEAMKLNFIFCKKSLKVNNDLKTVIFKKKKLRF